MEEKFRNCEKRKQLQENLNYISDEALEQLICQVEQEELVTAPPDLMEGILRAAGLESELSERFQTADRKPELEHPEQGPKLVQKRTESGPASRKKEFYAYCFRVITSVAAAIALVFLLPELSGISFPESAAPEQSGWETIVEEVPDRETVISTETIPDRDEVLNPEGFFSKVFSETGIFKKDYGSGLK